jgi:uncharacterized protein YndB with AHSA1/START domain
MSEEYTQLLHCNCVYVTYIRTTPEKLWAALTTPEFMKKYWFGMNIETDWKAGSPWKLVFPDGRVADAGEVVEIEKPKRLILRWRNQFRPDLNEEGYARCVIEINPAGEVVKLTTTHLRPPIFDRILRTPRRFKREPRYSRVHHNKSM